MSDADVSADEGQPKVKTIVVVEDDASVGEFLVDALKSETTHQALLAIDGFQAEEIVKSLVPDLFVLDYQLPKMNGLELYDHFQEQEKLRAIPALFMSANAPLHELQKRHVFSIRKPFELEDLLATIDKLLAEQ